jgi:sporulation protein YlmC with PRC-barrel domain
MAAKRKAKDFIPDSRNANKGTVRGLAMLEDSLRKYGAGRSILVDKNNNIIAGNKTHQAAIDLGLDDVIVVPTDGKQLVVVQRVDIDIDSKQGRELAIADNRVGQVDLEFDPDVLMGFAEEGIDLAQYWNDGELAAVLGQGDDLDYEKAWQGMPDFVQKDAFGVKALIVHFKTDEDVKAFADLVQQTITDKTKYIWYPAQEKLELKKYQVRDES